MKFSQLPLPQRAGLVVLAAVQLGLLVAAEVDIQRRPAEQVAGRKLWWRAICLINFIGPLTYLRWGRKRPTLEAERHPETTATQTVGAAR
jgi:hypothetical protein